MLLKRFTQSNAISYGTVFALEAALFIVAAILALRVGGKRREQANPFVLAAQHDLR